MRINEKSMTWKRALTQPCCYPDLELSASRTAGNKCLLLISCWPVVFCYSGPSGLCFQSTPQMRESTSHPLYQHWLFLNHPSSVPSPSHQASIVFGSTAKHSIGQRGGPSVVAASTTAEHHQGRRIIFKGSLSSKTYFSPLGVH